MGAAGRCTLHRHTDRDTLITPDTHSSAKEGRGARREGEGGRERGKARACAREREAERPGGMNNDTAADVEGQVQGNPLADDEDDLAPGEFVTVELLAAKFKALGLAPADDAAGKRVDGGTGVPAVMARLGSAPTNWHQGTSVHARDLLHPTPAN